LACASAVASINVFRDDDVLGQARALGDAIGPALAKIAGKHPAVGEVRGLGAFWAIELVRNRETREMLVPYNASGADAKPMQELMAACRSRGVWPFPHFNRIHVAPPLTTSLADLELGLERIDDALTVADQYAID
jgi:taurine--2-oxoglutarate transaminase